MKIDVSPYLSKLQAASARNQPEDPIQKNTLKALLTRIKYSRLSRSKREAIYRMVRDLAVNDRLDAKAAKSVMEMIFMSEMIEKSPKEKDFKLGGRDKTVQEQMDEIASIKADRKAQKDELDRLGSLFSAKA